LVVSGLLKEAIANTIAIKIQKIIIIKYFILALILSDISFIRVLKRFSFFGFFIVDIVPDGVPDIDVPDAEDVPDGVPDIVDISFLFYSILIFLFYSICIFILLFIDFQ